MMSRSKWLPLKSITVGYPSDLQRRQRIVHETEFGQNLATEPSALGFVEISTDDQSISLDLNRGWQGKTAATIL